MKLIFEKNDALEISVLHKDGDEKKDFSYVEMMKSLMQAKILEEPDMNGDFSDSEKESIKSMVEHINKEVSDFYSEEEEEE